jgi:Flp pilus assembly protein TadG
MEPSNRRAESERGAILVHVALGMIAFMAFSLFVVDYGVYWTSRRQAQNSADAGALAGATALVGLRDFSPGGPASTSAIAVAKSNIVWGAVPDVQPGIDVTFPGDVPPGTAYPVCNLSSPGYVGGDCIRVDVYRTAGRNNPLPMFFGMLIGRNTQDVRATATARVVSANASDCLAPIAIIDKPGGGYTTEFDLGTNLILKDDQAWSQDPSYHGFLTWAGNGARDVSDALKTCLSGVHYIGEDITTNKKEGNSGGVKQGVDGLVGLDDGDGDPAATSNNDTLYWDTELKTIRNSCVESGSCHVFDADMNIVAAPGATMSPRVIALPVIDEDLWNASQTMKIVNILGFFVVGTTGNGDKDILGIIVSKPGIQYTGPGAEQPDPNGVFLKTVLLIR